MNVPVIHYSGITVYKEVFLQNEDPDMPERNNLCQVITE